MDSITTDDVEKTPLINLSNLDTKWFAQLWWIFIMQHVKINTWFCFHTYTRDIFRVEKFVLLLHNYARIALLNYLAKWRLTARNRNVSKLQDSAIWFFNGSEIWQANRRQRCRYACQMLVRYDHHNFQSLGLGASRDLTLRRLTA